MCKDEHHLDNTPGLELYSKCDSATVAENTAFHREKTKQENNTMEETCGIMWRQSD